MSGWIVGRSYLVPAAADNPAFLHNHGAERSAATFAHLLDRQTDGFLHKGVCHARSLCAAQLNAIAAVQFGLIDANAIQRGAQLAAEVMQQVLPVLNQHFGVKAKTLLSLPAQAHKDFRKRAGDSRASRN